MEEQFDELNEDAGLKAMFQSVEQRRPRSGFVDRTILATRGEVLPAGRRALRRPWSGALHWAAGIATATAVVYGAAINLAAVAPTFVWLLAQTIQAPLRLLQFVDTALDLWGLAATIGEAFGKVLATREASTGLIVVAIVGLTSLSILRRLLVSEKESFRW